MAKNRNLVNLFEPTVDNKASDSRCIERDSIDSGRIDIALDKFP